MKVQRPATEIDVCDLCGSPGYLTLCVVCDSEYCLRCQGMVPQSWGFTDLCQRCAGRDDVRRVCREYADRLTPIYEERSRALASLKMEESE